MQVQYISNITKEFPKMIQVIIYHEPRPFVYSDSSKSRKASSDSEPTISSVNRTKSLISDLVLCNEFDMFATFTFSPKYHVDRYNETACRYYLTRWFHHQKERTSPDLVYLAVPEKHKDGALHFHVLLKNYNGQKRDSGKRQNGRPVYNITSWRAGFSTAVEIDNLNNVALYCKKYITKDFCKSYNKHRFFCSKGLQRPVKTTNSQLFHKFFHRAEKVHENADCAIYNIAKSDIMDL